MYNVSSTPASDVSEKDKCPNYFWQRAGRNSKHENIINSSITNKFDNNSTQVSEHHQQDYILNINAFSVRVLLMC